MARAGIDASGNFFYSHGAIININNGIIIDHNDSDFREPHIIVIDYNERLNKLTINIDGDEHYRANVIPITASSIKTVRIGEDFVGRISNFSAYATNISLSERNILAKILSKSNNVVVSELELSSEGITTTSSNPSSTTSCGVGYLVSGENCIARNYVNDFISHYGASDLTDLQNNYFMDPSSVSYNENSNNLPCLSGYGTSSGGNYSFNATTGDITIIGICEAIPTAIYFNNPSNLLFHNQNQSPPAVDGSGDLITNKYSSWAIDNSIP